MYLGSNFLAIRTNLCYNIKVNYKIFLELQLNKSWRGVREVEGGGLENHCTGQPVPRVRIPLSPPKNFLV